MVITNGSCTRFETTPVNPVSSWAFRTRGNSLLGISYTFSWNLYCFPRNLVRILLFNRNLVRLFDEWNAPHWKALFGFCCSYRSCFSLSACVPLAVQVFVPCIPFHIPLVTVTGHWEEIIFLPVSCPCNLALRYVEGTLFLINNLTSGPALEVA